MNKPFSLIATLFLFASLGVPALAEPTSPTFWAQIKDNGRRIEVFAASRRDSNFRCDLNVQFETADGTPGNFLCEAKVYGKIKEALVCTDRTRGERYTAIRRIRQFCDLN